MEIQVFAPKDVESIKIDKSALQKDLSVSDYRSLFENDDLDYFKLFETYGFHYFVNATWVRVVTNTGSSFEISSHEILSELFHSPDQFEGIEAHIIGHFLGVFSSVAGGQGGGLLLIDLQNNRKIFSTNSFSVQSIIWIEKYKVFICLHDVATYAWHTISLMIIDEKGKNADISLYSHYHLENNNPYNPTDLKIVEKVSDRNEEAYGLAYNEKNDILYIKLDSIYKAKAGKLLENLDFS